MSVIANSVDWNPYSVKASWVAVFILFLFWWLAWFFQSLFHSTHSIGKLEEGVISTGHLEKDDGGRERTKRVARHFRDGLLFLLTAVALDTVAAGPYGASNALAWVFTAFWIILGIVRYFTRSNRLLAFLSFLSLVLLVALISNAFAHPANVKGASS